MNNHTMCKEQVHHNQETRTPFKRRIGDGYLSARTIGCNNCSARFYTTKLLRRHERMGCGSHQRRVSMPEQLTVPSAFSRITNTRKYVCPFCSSSYLSESAVRTHIIHTCSVRGKSKVTLNETGRNPEKSQPGAEFPLKTKILDCSEAFDTFVDALPHKSESTLGALDDSCVIDTKPMPIKVEGVMAEFETPTTEITVKPEVHDYTERFDISVDPYFDELTGLHQSSTVELLPVPKIDEQEGTTDMIPTDFCDIILHDASDGANFTEMSSGASGRSKSNRKTESGSSNPVESGSPNETVRFIEDRPQSIPLGPFPPGFQCKVCGKTYVTRGGLKYHVWTHTRPRRNLLIGGKVATSKIVIESDQNR